MASLLDVVGDQQHVGATSPTQSGAPLKIEEPLYAFRSDAYAQRYNDPPLTNLSQADALIQRMNEGFAAHEMILWAVALRENNRAIGLFGFNKWDRGHNGASIGYNLAREHWEQGLSKEALKAMLGFGFERMHLNRIESETVASNTESVRLLERSGFYR